MKTGRSSDHSASWSEDDASATVAARRETRRTDPREIVGQLLEEMRGALQGHPESRERRTFLGKRGGSTPQSRAGERFLRTTTR
jgi:hypothetical protein